MDLWIIDLFKKADSFKKETPLCVTQFWTIFVDNIDQKQHWVNIESY